MCPVLRLVCLSRGLWLDGVWARWGGRRVPDGDSGVAGVDTTGMSHPLLVGARS
jgi:hypothetical protein